MPEYWQERDMIEAPPFDPETGESSMFVHYMPGSWHFYKDGIEITEQEYLEAVRDA